jgi:hypothetical protein
MRAGVAVAVALGVAARVGGQWTTPDAVIPFQDELAEVHITLETEALEALFHPDSVWSNFEHPATFVYVSEGLTDTLESVGFRLRGNTSRTAGKKSFKVSFDAFDEDAQWQGLDKLNLNGSHNDVSMMRARNVHAFFNEHGVASSRANHLKLFINGDYRGLYTNVEHIDGEWLERRIPHAHGNLWKCTYPANLLYNGPDGEDYQYTPSWSTTRVYELKTNEDADDYSALAGLINALNNASDAELPCALEDRFDVDSYLRTAAAEILVGHWDNYIGNQNNFYLYARMEDGRLTYVPYDVDNTLGVQWFGEWINGDPYNWTSENRPLYTRLMEVPLYRDLFTWHMRDLLAAGFTVEAFEARSSAWLAEALEAAEADPFYPVDYGFGMEDFAASVSANYGQHIPYGIVPYVGGRAASANLQLDPPAPHPGWVMGWTTGPVVDGMLQVEARVSGEPLAVEAWVSEDGGTGQTHPLSDPDADGLYQASIPLAGTEQAAVQVQAAFANGATRVSPCTPQTVWTAPADLGIRLNEVMPLNNSFLADASGGYGDWVELTVVGDAPRYLGNHYLTNRLTEPQRWPLPNVTLDPGSHLLIWCDDDPEQGPLHAPFNLDADGDALYIMTLDNGAPRVLDHPSWSAMPPNVSWARVPDGTGPWTACAATTDPPPTPDAPNEAANGLGTAPHPTAAPYPNPATRGSVVTFPNARSGAILDLAGRVVGRIEDGIWPVPDELPAGTYFAAWLDPSGHHMHAPLLMH